MSKTSPRRSPGAKLQKLMDFTKKEILNPERRAAIRAEVVGYRNGAISNAFMELDGIINKSAFTRDYIKKSQGWFSQRLHGAHVCCTDVQFKPDEARLIAASFRDIARRLEGLATEIEAVADID